MPNLEQFKSKEEYRKWYANYREKNREKIRNINREYKKRNPYSTITDGARTKLSYAIKKGIIKRACYSVCGAVGAEGHHFDYSKPLEVIWLCPIHHKDMHRKYKK
jgi:hypothetical protein